MTNQTLNNVESESCNPDLRITFIVQQGLISVHTSLTHVEQLSGAVSVNANSQWTIGRSNHCDILLNNSTVSRQHAVLGYDHHFIFYIMDYVSHNGTFLNQIRLIPLKAYRLRDRDLLEISRQTIQINISHKNSEP